MFYRNGDLCWTACIFDSVDWLGSAAVLRSTRGQTGPTRSKTRLKNWDLEAVGGSKAPRQHYLVQMELRYDCGFGDLQFPSVKTRHLTRGRKFKQTFGQMHLLEGAAGTMKKIMKRYIPKKLTHRCSVSWAWLKEPRFADTSKIKISAVLLGLLTASSMAVLSNATA